ncbi:MAG TPA: tetraacyldisaccharide 4'-kinase [Candidatus Bathyarchaeia archaeon]|nr:tetraacyldisaccharide 4'-kinase [Candidatus Bathyarchaeia archaeon]
MSSFLYALSEKIRRGDPVPVPLAAVLSAATIVQRMGMWARLRTKPVRVDARVISFGNITAGGTGKTPAVIERVRAELAAGRRVAVLTRGYGYPKPRLIAEGKTSDDLQSDDLKFTIIYARSIAGGRSLGLGDEPDLIVRKCPDVVIVKSANRVEGARMAMDTFECNTLILDDGFQYVRLARDENVCVIDAGNPFGNGRLVPRGILREKPNAIRRATHILLTHCDRAVGLDVLLSQLKTIHPSAPIRMTRHAPRSLWRVRDGQQLDLSELRGKRISAACAIATPESFFLTLRGLGAELESERTFPDHALLPQDALQGPGLVVVTEKDAVKLLVDPPENLYALGIELEDVPECDAIGARGGTP